MAEHIQQLVNAEVILSTPCIIPIDPCQQQKLMKMLPTNVYVRELFAYKHNNLEQGNRWNARGDTSHKTLGEITLPDAEIAKKPIMFKVDQPSINSLQPLKKPPSLTRVSPERYHLQEWLTRIHDDPQQRWWIAYYSERICRVWRHQSG